MPCPFCGTKEGACACTFSFAPARAERAPKPADVPAFDGAARAGSSPPLGKQPGVPEQAAVADTRVLLQFLRDFTSSGPEEPAAASSGSPAATGRIVRGPFGPGSPLILESDLDPIAPTFSWPFDEAGEVPATPGTGHADGVGPPTTSGDGDPQPAAPLAAEAPNRAGPAGEGRPFAPPASLPPPPAGPKSPSGSTAGRRGAPESSRDGIPDLSKSKAAMTSPPLPPMPPPPAMLRADGLGCTSADDRAGQLSAPAMPC